MTALTLTASGGLVGALTFPEAEARTTAARIEEGT